MPPGTRSLGRGAAAGAVLAVAGLLALQIAGFHGLRYDDAFITYRYGQNLATGNGLVFNLGERVMGSTSPLHSLLSALVYALVGHDRLPSVMSALGCAGWMAQAVAAFFLLRGALGRMAAALVALAVAAGAAWSFEWVALETDLAAAFALWAVVAAVGSRWVAAAVLLGLAGLTRPDALLLGLPLGLLALPEARAGRASWWKPPLGFAAVVGPWLIFAWWWFGTVVPQSAYAKVGRSSVASYLRHLLADPASILLPGRDGALWTAAAWLLAVLGAVLLVRRRPRLWVLPAWGLLHFAAYWVLRPFEVHRWHLYPLGLVVVLLALAAVGALARFEPRRVARPLAVVALAGLIAVYGGRSLRWVGTVHGYGWGGRDRVYQAAAGYLVEHADPARDRVAAVEVGTLAYYSGFEMFDLGGLTSKLTPDPRSWPRVDWFVLDPVYLRIVPGQRPVAAFRSGGFTAYVFDVRGSRKAPPPALEPAGGAP
jgi:hypothetical protein